MARFPGVAFACFVLVAGAAAGARAADDALAAELARWDAFLRENPSGDPFWKEIKDNEGPGLARAQQALAARRRLLALLRLAPVHEGLTAGRYVGERTPAQRKDPAAFEAEWARVGAALAERPPRALEDVRPALLRALLEAARPQARIYYDASLEYGRSTTPDSGLYYLGAALAAREFEDVARRLAEPSPARAPPVRALAPDIDALEDALLAAYRPPLAIDKHREFITASAALKEARELDAAGLRYGALLRYLLASLRYGTIGAAASPTPPASAITQRLRALEARLSRGVDHTLGRVFVEAAEADLAEAAPGEALVAQAVVSEVLPRYAAALAAAPRRPAPATPRVTVTLVRWPYT
jgi:hypothetical protein